MEIGRALGYISEDDRWTNKLLLGAIVSVIPFANFAVIGYSLQIARNVADEVERPLPEWDDFTKLLVDGLRLIGAYFVYLLPVFLALFCMMAVGVASMAYYESAAASSTTNDPFPAPVIAVYGLSLVCFLPYSLLLYAIWPMFGIQVARTNRFAACFDFKEMVRLVRAQPVNYLLILAMLFGLYMAQLVVIMPALVVAIVIPCIGYILYMLVNGAAITLMVMVLGHMQGQFIRLDKAMLDGDVGLESGLV